MTRRRIICDRYGEPADVLRAERQPPSEPRSGELLVRMLARPINPSDLIPVRGSYAHRTTLPMIPGYEGVGVVVEAGDAANRSLIGRRVLPLRGEGTWQSLVRVPAATAVEAPIRLDDDQAAQAYINPLTAWATCTDELALGEGDTLVINAGGSAIGCCYAQLSRRLGFSLIAIVRDARHVEPLYRLGAAHVIVEGEQPSVAATTATSTAELLVAGAPLRQPGELGSVPESQEGIATSQPHESQESMMPSEPPRESRELRGAIDALREPRELTGGIDAPRESRELTEAIDLPREPQGLMSAGERLREPREWMSTSQQFREHQGPMWGSEQFCEQQGPMWGSGSLREPRERISASGSPHESQGTMSVSGGRSESGDLAAAVAALTGGRLATAAIDSVGGTAGAALAGCVRPGGRLLTIGLLSGSPVPWPQVSKRTGVQVGLFHLRHWNGRVPVARWRSEMERLLHWMAAGLLALPTPTGRYALPEIGVAVRAAERPGAGKILLTEEQ
ncbi:hypothetical protein PA598K_03635 [Paenibacillus sp. 598K]|uniref:zinc-dependent alcohol dehydrogenase family protein n=1 Tax=Paenibacillus sp. 598K TaxID=1117987 RepID=UPI000FF910E2|nr:zinc-dependent alcohol dehydrogenase family protein [Paenibacillus sp. 598K]GBF75244.1 hypothetical protein PA598K_03635 [Paenibacillus sp. 598K]